MIYITSEREWNGRIGAYETAYAVEEVDGKLVASAPVTAAICHRNQMLGAHDYDLPNIIIDGDGWLITVGMDEVGYLVPDADNRFDLTALDWPWIRLAADDAVVRRVG